MNEAKEESAVRRLVSAVAVSVVTGGMGVGCGDERAPGSAALEAGESEGVGKADGAHAWHDFLYEGREVLNRRWKLHGGWSAAEDELLELEVQAARNPSRETGGTLSVEAPCQPFGAAPGRAYPGGLGAILALLDLLDSLSCLAEGGTRSRTYGMRVFPLQARRKQLRSYAPLLEGCGALGETGGDAMFFEWIYRRSPIDALRWDSAIGCFRVHVTPAGPELWMRVVDAAEPASAPSDWVVLVDADSSCSQCVSAGGGTHCAAQCQGASCIDCIEHEGGRGCLSACISDACALCLGHGGNRGCLSRCDSDLLPEACRTCVEASGGSGCLERCAL